MACPFDTFGLYDDVQIKASERLADYHRLLAPGHQYEGTFNYLTYFFIYIDKSIPFISLLIVNSPLQGQVDIITHFLSSIS